MTDSAAANVAAVSPIAFGRTRDTFLWPSIVTVLLVFVGGWLSDQTGSPLAVPLILWGPLLVYCLFLAPVHISARYVLLLGLILESPDERAGNDYWTPPFVPASTIWFDGLKKSFGIPGISFSFFTLMCLLLFLRARRAKRPPGYTPVPREVAKAVAYWFLGLTALLIWGVFVQGGQGQPSYWQMIQLVTMGLCSLAFLYSFRGPADFRAIGTIVVVAAVTKGLLVAWVYEVVCRPLNIKPFYATTHSDSVTFAFAIIIVATNWFEHRDKASLKRLWFIVPFLILAIVMNNRRLAFVGVGFGVFTTFAVLKASAAKKRLTRIIIGVTPVFWAYVKIGGNSSNPLFAPAALINSVTNQTDSSSLTREIENYNLISTLKGGRILGTGFGHEYIEFVKADDISAGFSMYRFIPHNSVLWVWSFGGLIGFCAIWFLYPLLAFFAARGYRLGRSGLERAAGLTTLAATMSVMAQDWGDMGLNSYTNVLIFSICFTVAVKLCAASEPVPVGART